MAFEQVVRTEPAEIHPPQLEPDRRRIRGHNQTPDKAPPKPTVGKSEEHVQEEHRGYQVDRLSHRVHDIARRPDERRDEVDETSRDHQRAKTTRGAPPPCEETAK